MCPSRDSCPHLFHIFLSEMRHGKRLRPHSPLEARKRMHHSDNTESITDSTNTYSPQETCHFQESLPRDHIDSHDEDSPDRGEPHDTSDSDMSTVAYPMMEESWLVTPPACFTAGTSKMETSSMENLLIEHPSMSVYHHRGRQSSTGLDSDNSESSNDGESGGVTRSQAGLARHQPSHRPRALVGRAGLNQVKTAVRSMQQSQQRNLYKSLSHNNLRRANLTQHSQGKVTRKHTVHQPSARHIRTNIKQC